MSPLEKIEMSPYNMQSFNKGVANVRGDKNGKKSSKKM